MALCDQGIAHGSRQPNDTRQGVQRTRGRCAAHARAMLHVRSAAHGPLVESSESLEREQDALNQCRRDDCPHSASRRQKCVVRNASSEM